MKIPEATGSRRLEWGDPEAQGCADGISELSTHLMDGTARAKRRRRSVVLLVPSFTSVSNFALHFAAACSQATFVGKPV